jgi:hypothetical protein
MTSGCKTTTIIIIIIIIITITTIQLFRYVRPFSRVHTPIIKLAQAKERNETNRYIQINDKVIRIVQAITTVQVVQSHKHYAVRKRKYNYTCILNTRNILITKATL